MKPPSFATLFAVLLFPLALAAVANRSNGESDPRPTVGAGEKHVHLRGDLAHLKQQLESGGRCHVAFLGGSITENKGGHAAMVPAWLESEFPGCDFEFTNAGWASTCSTSGAFRLDSQVFGGTPVDLLIVEFAVNDDQDAAHPARECVRGMEGVVRHVRRDHPHCEVLMVHFVNPEILATLRGGGTPVSIAAHEQVAEHYSVTSVSVAAEVAEGIGEARYSWDDYGGTHPKKFGYELASNMIIAAIRQGLAEAPRGGPARDALPDPIDPASYDGGMLVPPGKAGQSGGWRIGRAGPKLLPAGNIRSTYTGFDVLRGDRAGDSLEFEFEGRGVGAFVLAGPDAGVVETSVDGAPFVKHDLYHRFSGGLNYPRSVIFSADLIPGRHRLKLRIAPEKNERSTGTTASILFFEVNR